MANALPKTEELEPNFTVEAYIIKKAWDQERPYFVSKEDVTEKDLQAVQKITVSFNINASAESISQQQEALTYCLYEISKYHAGGSTFVKLPNGQDMVTNINNSLQNNAEGYALDMPAGMFYPWIKDSSLKPKNMTCLDVRIENV